MAISGQGAPGVRIKLRDLSEVQIVDNPIVTGGVVGFSAKGPLNKIIQLGSTETMDVTLGSGYNNPKYNQGLYATRGILNTGGNMEFVRPYGEEVITDAGDADYNTSQELQTDSFIVSYDFDSGATDSIGLGHYAASRWLVDGMASDFPGASREIYTIQEAITEGTNVNFVLDAGATGTGGNTVALFSIMNEDPTAATRAVSTDVGTPVTDTGKDYLTVKTAASNTASRVTEILGITEIPTLNDTFGARLIDGTFKTLEFVSEGGSVVTGDVAVDVEIATVADVTTGVNTTSDEITVDDSTNFQIGDTVMVTGGDLPGGLAASTEYVIDTLVGAVMTFDSITLTTTGTGAMVITNLSAILRNIKTGLEYVNENAGITEFGINLVIPTSDLTTLNVEATRGVSVADTIATMFDLTSLASTYLDVASFTVVETTPSVLTQDDIGRKFVALGLADESYIDIDFDGAFDRVFTLNADGVAIAAIYLEVDYFFAGELYNFSGTVVPYVHNDANLYIQDSAESVESGWKFVINENQALIEASSDSLFDLSSTITGGLTAAEFSIPAYDANDLAVINDAIWSYDPKLNNTTAILSSAWDLFLDKDKSSADMLVSAGTAISNLFARGLEEINYTVMDKMLVICEKRKDMFAIFDGVDESRVDVALKKMVGIGSQGNDIGRWGAIFDGRSMYFDTTYTRLTTEVVKSIEVAQIITANRVSGVYWFPPAGYNTGRVPSFMATRQKYQRSYNYAEDANSDIARLYDANINPTRVNQSGSFIYGQKTMLKRSTALNRLNVIMLLAGIHRRFSRYLDQKVFQLNTATLRNNIQSELQSQLDSIKTANPAGITDGRVICDATNNPPSIIDTNQLIVDVLIQPTRSAEFITLRTTVQRTGADLNVSNVTIIGG
jgi:hypothetical protein